MFTIHYFLFNPSHSLANSLLNSCQTQNRFSCGWVGVVTILVWPQSKVSPEYGTAQTQLVNIFVWRMRQEKPHPSITILLSPQTQVQLWLSWGCDNLALLSVGQLPRLLKVKVWYAVPKGRRHEAVFWREFQPAQLFVQWVPEQCTAANPFPVVGACENWGELTLLANSVNYLRTAEFQARKGSVM